MSQANGLVVGRQKPQSVIGSFAQVIMTQIWTILRNLGRNIPLARRRKVEVQIPDIKSEMFRQ